MISYFTLQTVHLGPIPIQVWGFFVSAGILAALVFSLRIAAGRGLDKARIWDMAFGMLVSAFVLARLVHVFGYFGSFYLSQPLEIFKVWQGGFSAAGGVFGAVLYGWYFCRRFKLNFYEYLDVIAQGFPLGYAIGRVGCFLIHDHPGTLSDFVLAVKYPGGARHDLGLYLSLAGVVLFLTILIARYIEKRRNKKFGNGFYSSVMFIGYGLARFCLDFLRAYDLPYADVRYASLTVAQYFGLLLVFIGCYNLFQIYVRQSRRGQ